MSKVQLIVTIENDEQADKVLAVLNEAEVNGELDFAFDVERRNAKEDLWRSDVLLKNSVQADGNCLDHSRGKIIVCDNLLFAEQQQPKETNE